MTYDTAKRSARSYLEYIRRYEAEAVTSRIAPPAETHAQFVARIRGILAEVENVDRSLQEASDALFPSASLNFKNFVETKLMIYEEQRKVELAAAGLSPELLTHDEFLKQSKSFLNCYKELQHNPPGSMEIKFEGNRLICNIIGTVTWTGSTI